MRGADRAARPLFRHVDLEERIPARHPLRTILQVVNGGLADLDVALVRLYAADGRSSIAPERLIRAGLLQVLCSTRSVRQPMEQMQNNPLFRWFVEIGIDDPVWGEGRREICPTDRY